MKKSKVVITVSILCLTLLSYNKAFAIASNQLFPTGITCSGDNINNIPTIGSYVNAFLTTEYNANWGGTYSSGQTPANPGNNGVADISGHSTSYSLAVPGADTLYFYLGTTVSGNTLNGYTGDYFFLDRRGGICSIYNPTLSTDTRIISVTSPLDESVQASTTVTFSGTFYVASSTIATTSNVFMYLYIQNRSNDTATSSLNDYTILNFPVTALNTTLSFSTTTVLTNNARFSWTGNVRRGDITYGTVPFSDGKAFYQFTTGSFDPTFGKNFDLTTCNPFSGFDIAQCIYNLVFPNNVIFPIAFNEAKEELGKRVPWGYVTRIINILISTTTATSMPTIDYSFASSSPMSSVGNIHFEPFTLIAQSGTLINEMKSDRTDSKTVWEIFMPFINMFIYIVLLFMIIHDLTGIHSSKVDNDKQKE